MKPVKIIKVEKVLHITEPTFRVLITKRMYNRLPSWVHHQARARSYANENHYSTPYVYFLVQAKDELEAMMRFRRFWAGLPEE